MRVERELAVFRKITITFSSNDCGTLWLILDEMGNGKGGGWHEAYSHFPECFINHVRDVFEAQLPSTYGRLDVRIVLNSAKDLADMLKLVDDMGKTTHASSRDGINLVGRLRFWLLAHQGE